MKTAALDLSSLIEAYKLAIPSRDGVAASIKTGESFSYRHDGQLSDTDVVIFPRELIAANCAVYKDDDAAHVAAAADIVGACFTQESGNFDIKREEIVETADENLVEDESDEGSAITINRESLIAALSECAERELDEGSQPANACVSINLDGDCSFNSGLTVSDDDYVLIDNPLEQLECFDHAGDFELAYGTADGGASIAHYVDTYLGELQENLNRMDAESESGREAISSWHKAQAELHLNQRAEDEAARE